MKAISKRKPSWERNQLRTLQSLINPPDVLSIAKHVISLQHAPCHSRAAPCCSPATPRHSQAAPRHSPATHRHSQTAPSPLHTRIGRNDTGQIRCFKNWIENKLSSTENNWNGLSWEQTWEGNFWSAGPIFKCTSEPYSADPTCKRTSQFQLERRNFKHAHTDREQDQWGTNAATPTLVASTNM